MDASIMVGNTLRCGGVTGTHLIYFEISFVSGAKTVKNPISLARSVMENTEHVLLAYDGAEKFADGMIQKFFKKLIVYRNTD